MKILPERLKELNKVLAAIGKYGRDISNKEIIEREKFGMSAFYTARKKLQLLGRISKRDNKEVIDPSDVTMDKYKMVGDPYNKKSQRRAKSLAGKGTVGKKAARKAVKKIKANPGIYMERGEGKVHETLTNPIELPLYEHKSGAEISISGTADGVIRFIRLLKDGVLG